MSIDLGNNPTGTPPTTAQAGFMRDALGIGTGDNVTFNKVGIGLGATGPVTALDINSSEMCIREPRTPSPGATSPTGTICWDQDNVYVQTGASGWKYAALAPVAGATGATGATGLIDGATAALEYIPFLATSEQLSIRVDVTGATGATGATDAGVILGTQYTPFEYAIIEGTVATIETPSIDNIEWNSPPEVGDYVIVSLKVSDTYLETFAPSDTITPGYTLSGVYALSSGFDCSITFTVTPRA
jgi:hypothetical protein